MRNGLERGEEKTDLAFSSEQRGLRKLPPDSELYRRYFVTSRQRFTIPNGIEERFLRTEQEKKEKRFKSLEKAR